MYDIEPIVKDYSPYLSQGGGIVENVIKISKTLRFKLQIGDI